MVEIVVNIYIVMKYQHGQVKQIKAMDTHDHILSDLPWWVLFSSSDHDDVLLLKHKLGVLCQHKVEVGHVMSSWMRSCHYCWATQSPNMSSGVLPNQCLYKMVLCFVFPSVREGLHELLMVSVDCMLILCSPLGLLVKMIKPLPAFSRFCAQLQSEICSQLN